MRGHFITFEGVEGSGKSTVIPIIAGRFEKAGHSIVVTREPGGTAVSEQIRKILLDPEAGEMSGKAELFLYLASRAQLVAERIGPALQSGRIVLCDRFYDATTAYQGWARGLGEEDTERLSALAVEGAVPDLTFVLDLPVKEGFKRGPDRRESSGLAQRDRLEREDMDFHRRVREGYLRIARREPGRVVVIDASRDLESVISEIIGNIKGRLGVQI